MKVTESKQNLLDQSVENLESATTSINLNIPVERPLGPIEKTFLLHAERGDCATVRRLIEEHGDNPAELDINCVDPLNRSALISAIENENIELIKLLLENNIKVNDGLLHAIKEEYVEAVELLLQWEEEHHQPGQPYSWEAVDRGSATFTSDITPLILAAHKNNYEIIKILLDRGATLPMPHDVRCGCDECVDSSSADSLRHSQSRINAYRALTASSLIALSSKDPLLTAFELSWELRKLSRVETEFRAEYNEMRASVQVFATSLLDHARTSYELEIMLNFASTEETWEPGERQTLDRLRLAIKYKQKMFVAHPNVQQLLAAIWYEGLPGFRRKGLVGQLFQVGKLGAMFPVYCTIYVFAPNSEMALFMKKPFVKFICHSSSYALFLMLLGAASQRVEVLALEWFGTEWMQEIVKEWKRKERGAGPGLAECGCIIYVISLIWGEVRSLWSDGILEYIADLWNIVDFITNMFYVMWIALRMSSWYLVWREEKAGKDPYYPREQWDSFEPVLLSEGAFAAGMIFSFLKLVHIFSVNPHLGPLQISLGRMIIDIVKFFFIYTLVLFAFGCGLNQLLWYYAELEKNKCYHLPSGLPDFDNNDKACTIWRRYSNLFETSQSLFWASFGLVDLVSFELTGIKGFTRFWALLMFGSYSVINVIVLLNMLIAMMSNSYQIISERSDTEWKFARTRLWMSYFDDGDTLPPPFNLCPTLKHVAKFTGAGKSKRTTQSFKKKSRENATERHQVVLRLLVRRYVTAEQRKRDDFGITEDDVMEIRQDISTLRYELIDILRQNGMKTPDVTSQDAQLSNKKGKVMERRLLKDFHIGIVEGIVSEVVSSTKEPKDVFSQIAKVIGRRASSHKKDWNALVRQNTVVKDPIGSAQEAEAQRMNRQSIRKHILSNISQPVTIDQDKLLEYNPKLSEVPKTARLAYAKFMTKKIQQDFTTDENVTIVDEKAAANAVKKDASVKARNIKTSTVKFRGATPEPIIKSDDQATTNIKAENKNISLKKDTKNITPDDSLKSNDVNVTKQPTAKTGTSVKAKPESAAKDTAGSKKETTKDEKTDADKSAKDEPKPNSPEIKRDPAVTTKGDENIGKETEKKIETDVKTESSATKDDENLQKTEDSKSEAKPTSIKKTDDKKETTTSSGSNVREAKTIPTGKSKLSGNIRTGWI